MKALEDMIRVSVQIVTSDTTEVCALFDTGSNVSSVSQALMKRMRLAVGLQPTGATTINEKPILTHGSAKLNIQIIDSEGMVCIQQNTLCADIGSEDLQGRCPKCIKRLREKKETYSEEKDKVHETMEYVPPSPPSRHDDEKCNTSRLKELELAQSKT